MKYLIMLILDAGLIGLYLYSKLSPFKDKLDAKHRGYFDTADKLFGWAAKGIGKGLKPYKVGEGVELDMGQLALFAILVFGTLIMMVTR